jgi:ribose transport system ATP-binding protein
MQAPESQPLLAVEGLTKDFPPLRALDGVSLGFAGGEVHALIGENGAGKTTLARILSGLLAPTSGRVLFRGERVSLPGPAAALRLGIALVHQELNLVDELPVADNLFLGREFTRWGLIKRRRTLDAARGLLDRVGVQLDPAAMLRSLSLAQQQMVEVAKALGHAATVLILDEPTAMLTEREAARLFELIAQLKQRGMAVLYISHRLAEVLAICDRITVLRDGRVVRTLSRAEAGSGPAAEAQLAALMVGRTLSEQFPARIPARDETVLTVRGLSAGERVRDVSFEVRAGEILGFAGLVGAGRTEMALALCGLRPRSAGRVELKGRLLAPANAREAMAGGLAYLTEDRRARGLFLDRSIAENVTISALPRYARLLLDRAAEQDAVAAQARRLAIRMGAAEEPAGHLSGGNQQKVLLARVLEVQPQVLILDEPTRGIDVGTKAELYRVIQELAGQGLACIVISSELGELLGLCHRVAVMRQGQLAAILEGEALTEENVMFHAAGVAGGAERGGH